jgi:hypothetical protein
MLCPFYYCLYSLFNKIRYKFLPGSEGVRGKRERAGDKREK